MSDGEKTIPGVGQERVNLTSRETQAGDDKEWYRVYTAFVRKEPSEIMAIEELIANIQNVNSVSRSRAIYLVFNAGLHAMSEDPTYACPTLTEYVLHAEMYSIAKARAARKKQFATIYEELGPIEIQEMAAERGVDVERFLDDYRLTTQPVAPSLFERMKRFIVTYLGDGLEHGLGDVVGAAVQAGVLPDKDSTLYERDYQTFKQAAAELRVSAGGRRGYWQMPLLDD